MVDSTGRQVVSAATEGGTLYTDINKEINEQLETEAKSIVGEQLKEKAGTQEDEVLAIKLKAFEKRMAEHALKNKEEEERKIKIKELNDKNIVPTPLQPTAESPQVPVAVDIKPAQIPPLNRPDEESEKINRLNNIGRTFSYIEDNEEEAAKNLIEEQLGFERPRVTGWLLAVKVWTRPEDMHSFLDDQGNKKSIIIPVASLNEDKYKSCTGLVLSIGPDAYKSGPRFEEPFYIKALRFIFRRPKKPWCKVGDWVVFPRNEGVQVNYRGMTMQYIPDDKVMDVVADPSYVTRD